MVRMPKPTVADDQITELAAALVPGSPPPFAMTEGLKSRAFGIVTGSERYVLRVGATRDGFDKDAHVANLLADSDLPIPDVLAIGDVGEHVYCLSRRLPGFPVNDVAPNDLSPLTDALHATLRRVWAHDVAGSTGYGMFDGDGVGAFASWHDYLTDRSPVHAAATRHGVPRGLAEDLYVLVVEQAGDCPEERALLHGDFGSANALTDGRSITGVLDWELAGYGDPLHDVAEILQWEGGEACMTSLARRLRRGLPTDADSRRRIDCYRAKLCLVELAWGAEETLAWMVGLGEALVHPVAPHVAAP